MSADQMIRELERAKSTRPTRQQQNRFPRRELWQQARDSRARWMRQRCGRARVELRA